MSPRPLVLLILPALLTGAFLIGSGRAVAQDPGGGKRRADPGCITCHMGIEVMHPWEPLRCTECHGGDGQATKREDAHVRQGRPTPNDERTVSLRYDLAYRRFVNPADLRVVQDTCGRCHSEVCADLPKSLHGTTAGHLSDGLYENGVVRSRTQRYAIFPVKDEDGRVPEHAYRFLPAIPSPAIVSGDTIGKHFADLPRKSCMQCHLYSRGVGLRGRLGQDGWYRSEGCAACHVVYAHDGLSASRDLTVDHLEPGHPLRHEMTSRIPTETCTTCHALDASIGMSFRGLGQLPPGVPGGPDVPGTTDRLSKGRFFIDDPAICPPDVHHEKGLSCVDCHDARDVMGDGNVYGVMEHGVAVRCSTCHGTFTERATFRNERGDTLPHLRWAGKRAVLKSKVTGKEHPVKQVADVLRPGHADHNPRAAGAMDAKRHGRLECYACHSGWSVNFFGFHFDRNESFTQLDILSGKRTPGRVTTQEKIFATFRNFYLGWDSEGRIAPYMVGFSTAGTFRDRTGRVVLRQALPVTAAGLSGMTLIHHQTHTVRPTARGCDECHGAPGVLGCGTENFHLFRDLFVAVGDAGLTVCGLDVKNPDRSLALTNLALPSRPRHVALRNDPVSGRARYAYVACRDGRVHVVDCTDPVAPRRVGSLDAEDARRVHVREGTLFVAAGTAGLHIASLENPKRPRRLAHVITRDARAVFVDGIHAYVADGPGGLRIVDVSVPAKPAVVAAVDLNLEKAEPVAAADVLVQFIAARPEAGRRGRSRARNVAFVADGLNGLYAVDVTRPSRPEVLSIFGDRGPRREFSGTALAFASSYDIGSAGGEIPSREREYLYLVGTDAGSSNGLLLKIDVSDPARPRVTGARRTVNDPRAVRIARVYIAPFLKQFALTAGRGRGNLEICDVTASTGSRLEGVGPVVGLDCEGMPLDRLVGFDGRPLKDVSHEGARLFSREEIARILRVDER